MPTTRRSRSHSAATKAVSDKGSLIIIGGREDKSSEKKKILHRVAQCTGRHRMVVATLATSYPKEVFAEYQKLFSGLGVRHIEHLAFETAEEARKPENIRLIRNSHTVFFSGGDQLRITTKIGGSPLVDELHDLYRRGGCIAGTSAGAAIMGDTMLLGGSSTDTTESHKVGNWMMAPGLGLVKNIIIDQHFGQRARIGRLLGAVALNPRVLGIGIDEDTSIIIRDSHLEVLGTNAVYIIDGHDVTYTNVAESTAERTMSLHDVKLHILCDGESFDLKLRQAKVCDAVQTKVEELLHL